MSQTQNKNETLLCTYRDCKNIQAENEYCTVHQDVYNGWSNYATWRVNLEIIDGIQWNDDIKDGNTYEDIAGLKEYLKQTVEAAVFGDDDTSGLMSSYALAFLQDVNYHEIAEHIAENYPSLITGVNTQNGEKI